MKETTETKEIMEVMPASEAEAKAEPAVVEAVPEVDAAAEAAASS